MSMQLEGLTYYHHKCPHFCKKVCLKHPNDDFILTREKKKSVQTLKADFYREFGEKIKIFYCYLLLAAENLLLAEQLRISASSSASKLPARANTSFML